ncbi:hypothetical protein KIPB_012338, partial [Kipferlia bialata]
AVPVPPVNAPMVMPNPVVYQTTPQTVPPIDPNAMDTIDNPFMPTFPALPPNPSYPAPSSLPMGTSMPSSIPSPTYDRERERERERGVPNIPAVQYQSIQAVQYQQPRGQYRPTYSDREREGGRERGRAEHRPRSRERPSRSSRDRPSRPSSTGGRGRERDAYPLVSGRGVLPPNSVGMVGSGAVGSSGVVDGRLHPPIGTVPLVRPGIVPMTTGGMGIGGSIVIQEGRIAGH